MMTATYRHEIQLLICCRFLVPPIMILSVPELCNYDMHGSHVELRMGAGSYGFSIRTTTGMYPSSVK